MSHIQWITVIPCQDTFYCEYVWKGHEGHEDTAVLPIICFREDNSLTPWQAQKLLSSFRSHFKFDSGPHNPKTTLQPGLVYETGWSILSVWKHFAQRTLDGQDDAPHAENGMLFLFFYQLSNLFFLNNQSNEPIWLFVFLCSIQLNMYWSWQNHL